MTGQDAAPGGPGELHPDCPDAIEQAEIDTTLAAHRAWVADGQPSAVSHEQAMAALLRE